MALSGITPGTVALLWRLAGVILLGGLWMAAPGDEVGLVLVLVLAILGLARWRFPLPGVDDPRRPGRRRARAVLLAARRLRLRPARSSIPASRPGRCTRSRRSSRSSCSARGPSPSLPRWSRPRSPGFAVHLWRSQLGGARDEADRDRRERYELESLKAELLSANVRVARMAEAAERSRIARDLHDHAGHEITAAKLALEAYRGLRDQGDPEAEELFVEAERRVADGMEILRRTARGISPEAPVGVGSLEEICRRFTTCPVGFAAHGDTTVVPVHAWGVLEPCLKEALTNASRHEAPGRIDVSLDVGPHIVRLCVHNPVRGAGKPGHGMGLRSLAQRAAAVGGSIATDTRDGFRLVCVLPLGNDAPP